LFNEADPDKILDATAPSYRFRDPFVETFSRQSLHAYFNLLQDRLSRAGTIRRPDIGFVLSGPMDHPSHPSEIIDDGITKRSAALDDPPTHGSDIVIHQHSAKPCAAVHCVGAETRKETREAASRRPWLSL
jgi:hypothetical protein